MARLVIRVTPNDHPDPELHKMRVHPGDVVCVTDDDHVFSKIEHACGHYMFVDFPGLPQEAFSHLVAPLETPDGGILQRKSKAIDLPVFQKQQFPPPPKTIPDFETIRATKEVSIDEAVAKEIVVAVISDAAKIDPSKAPILDAAKLDLEKSQSDLAIVAASGIAAKDEVQALKSDPEYLAYTQAIADTLKACTIDRVFADKPIDAIPEAAMAAG